MLLKPIFFTNYLVRGAFSPTISDYPIIREIDELFAQVLFKLSFNASALWAISHTISVIAKKNRKFRFLDASSSFEAGVGMLAAITGLLGAITAGAGPLGRHVIVPIYFYLNHPDTLWKALIKIVLIAVMLPLAPFVGSLLYVLCVPIGLVKSCILIKRAYDEQN